MERLEDKTLLSGHALVDNGEASFDFGTSTSVVESGYTGVTGEDRYSESVGYGWLSGNVRSQDRGAGINPVALTQDLNATADGTFVVDVVAGTYDVTVTMGDNQYPRDSVNLYLEGELQTTVATEIGEFFVQTFTVAVDDGQLTMRIQDSSGRGAINALTVATSSEFQLQQVLSDTGEPIQDGADLDHSPNQLTLRFSLGQEIDPNSLDGIHVTRAGSDGQFGDANDVVITSSYAAVGAPNEVILGFSDALPDDLYQITISGAGTTPLQNISGTAFNEGVDEFFTFTLGAQQDVLFDFGESTSAVESGYTGVTGEDRYSASAGYGWLSGNVRSQDRGAGINPVALTQDLNATADGTFVVDVQSGTYDVTVTMGDNQYPRDGVNLYLEGVLQQTVATEIGEFFVQTFTVRVDDGQLTMRIQDSSGRGSINAMTATTSSDFQLVGIQTESGTPLLDGDLLTQALTELTFRFTADQQIDPNSLDGIRVTRAGLDGQFGDAKDAVVTPVSAAVGQSNEVILTFADTIPDDLYRITILGTGAAPLLNTSGEPFNDRVDEIVTFTLDAKEEVTFDFGTSGSPLESGYTRLTGTDLYNTSAGYGWLSGANNLISRDRGAGIDPVGLTRDLNATADGTFVVDVTSGTYEVTVTMGDNTQTADGVNLFLEGALQTTLTMAAGEFATRTFTTVVDDGQLTMRIQADSGRGAINAFTITSMDFELEQITSNMGETIVDGVDLDQTPTAITLRFGPDQQIDPNSLDGIRVTRAGSDGLLGNADDVVVTPGSAVVGASNEVTLTFANALPDDLYQISILGTGAAPLLSTSGVAFNRGVDEIVTFTLGAPEQVLFDFGTSGSALESGYTRVTETDQYIAPVGYGWLSGNVISRDRGAGIDPLRLTRDLNATAGGTFVVDVMSGTYAVTVMMGDNTQTQDGVSLYAEGVLQTTMTMAAGEFATRTFTTVVDDGQLTLQIQADSGRAAINAVTITTLDTPLPATADFLLVDVQSDVSGPILDGDTLVQPPSELTFVFSAGQDINPTSLNGIVLTRAGFDGQFGDVNDVVVTPVTSSLSAPNKAILVFPGALINDLYQISIFGSGPTPLLNTSSEAFNAGVDQFVTFTVNTPPPPTPPSLQFIEMRSNLGGPIQNDQIIDQSPTELTFLFGSGQVIDPTTLAGPSSGFDDDGIQVVRAGADGMFGTADDVAIAPGFIGLRDNPNDVVLRFTETLPDDLYQVTIFGTGLNPLRDTSGNIFNDGVDVIRTFELDLGAQVVAIVPQPVTREQIIDVLDAGLVSNGDTISVTVARTQVVFELEDLNVGDGVDPANTRVDFTSGVDNATAIAAAIAAAINSSALGVVATPVGASITLTGDSTTPTVSVSATNPTALSTSEGGLVQNDNLIVVHFNEDDLDPASAIDPRFYQLIDTKDTLDITDDTVQLPTNVVYDDVANTVTLTYATIPNGTYRLRIGEADLPSTLSLTVGGGGSGGGGGSSSPINIDGQGFSGVNPPDAVGDVGVSHYVQAINGPSGSQITIYNKIDGTVAVPQFNLDSLAAGAAGGSVYSGLGDPVVLYDHLVDRWLLMEFESGSNELNIFISDDGIPTGNGVDWTQYRFAAPNFPDYPKIALGSDAYLISTNEGSANVPAYALPRAQMLAGTGGDITANVIRLTAPGLAGFGFQAFTPADLDGQAGAGNFFMRHRDDEVHNVGTNDPTQDFLEVWELVPDFVTPANSTFTQIANIGISEFDSDLNGLFAFAAFPQPGTSIQLDPLREVIMQRLQYRNFGTFETLVGNFVTDVDGTDHGGVRWFELRKVGAGNWTLFQEGEIAPDAENRWMAASAMDGDGNIAIGYNVTSTTVSPGIRYTGRFATDPLGTTLPEVTLIDGSGFNVSNRWGDYSAMSIDPVDDSTFWFTGMYTDGTGNWATRIGSFSVADISGTTPPTSDDNSSFATATAFSAAENAALGAGDLIVINSQIQRQSIALPPLPGGLDEPGHRQIPVESHFGSVGTVPVVPGAITQFRYNFQDVIGVDPQGNTLFNLISEEEKTRAREIFEIYSEPLGIEFIETPNSGLLVATGDMRAVDPAVPVGPGVVAGISGGGKVVMDPADTADSSFGGSWMGVALHEIGHALGLGHSYDIPSVQGAGLTGEPVFVGDHDFTHLKRLFRPDSTDIDLYEFDLAEDGLFSAEIYAERLTNVSLLNSALTLYRENADGSRDVIARNDDYFSNDAFLELNLAAGTYFVGVTSTGNLDYDPTVSDTGSGGTTDGAYELRFSFLATPTTGDFLIDATGTAFDGDADGVVGGVSEFWFQSGETVFVDKTNSASTTQDGSLADPFSEIDVALDAVNTRNTNIPVADDVDIIRIVGNGGADGDLATAADAQTYQIGFDDAFTTLEDGITFIVPQGVTVMVDEGAVFKLQNAIIDVGSSSDLIDRSQAALQILGTPDNQVVLTSNGNDAIGGDTDGVSDGANPGDWGGVVFRGDSDLEDVGVFLNYVNQADITFGGGQVLVDSVLDIFNPIHVINARPQISFNTITQSADAAISASLGSFADTIQGNRDATLSRIGLDVHGNTVIDNSINALFVAVETVFGNPIDKIDFSARFDDTDIIHVVTENIQIVGSPGGPIQVGGVLQARESGRLRIDAATVVKLSGSRIEAERGNSNFIAEGSAEQQIIFTSIFDDRYGRGGTSDTTNDTNTSTASRGDWGGLIFNAVSNASIDQAFLAFGGGLVPIEGGFDNFNVIEVHQADLRLTNSRLDSNANGRSVSRRTGRGTNDATTVFIRGAQPIIVGNVFVANDGSVASINANSMTSDVVRDLGRSTGFAAAFTQFPSNSGPLMRLNRLGSSSDLPVIPPVATELITNGDFETGDFTGWIGTGNVTGSWEINDGTINPPGNSGPLPPIAGNFDAINSQAIPGLPLLTEIINVPTNISSAVLSWSDRIRNEAGAFSDPNQEWRVQILDPSGGLLQEVFSTNPGDPSQQVGPNNRSFDITSLLQSLEGLQIQLSFTEQDDRGFFNVALDDVSLQISTGTPPPAPRAGTNGINGVEIRAEELTIESVWDDTDIVHVLRGEITIPNFHTFGGLRLESSTDSSLVVKLAGANAGFTAAGRGLDINDRIGGSLQIVGQPLNPVVLTSLSDDSIGAGLDLNGLPQNDTNGDGAPAAAPLSQAGHVHDASHSHGGPSADAGVIGDGFPVDGTDVVVDTPVIHESHPADATSDVPTILFGDSLTLYGPHHADAGHPGTPNTHFFAETGDADHFAWQDQDLSTLNVIDINYDFRDLNGTTNQITAGQITMAELALQAWEGATLGAINFVRNTTAPDADVVIIGTGDLAALGGTSGPGGTLGLGGGVFTHNANHTISSGAAWQDVRETWDESFNNGNPANTFDYFTVVAQEIGHAIGLGHTTDIPGPDLMDGNYSGEQTVASVNDIAHIRVVYGVGSGGGGGGTGAVAQPGDWRSIRLQEFSNDRNIEVVNELEGPLLRDLRNDEQNATPPDAQFLGELAPDVENGDENRRLGFEVYGFIAADDPGDVDVYSFIGEAGRQIWIDIDRTDPTLNTIVELLDPLGNILAQSINNTTFSGLADPLTEDTRLGGDFYTSNPNDPGMRLILPGVEGRSTTYFVRVRSNSTDLSVIDGGLTSGNYQLQIRVNQVDEQPGSTIRYADIRFATDGIEILGLPGHSPLVGEAGEAGDASGTLNQAQQLGNLLVSDRNTISLAGNISDISDVDFYQFTLDYDLVQAIAGVNGGAKTFATIFDIDYADGLSRPDTTLSIFDANGNLILVSRDSNIADDQPRPTEGTDFPDDLRGSAGALDPFIGSAQLPAGIVPAGLTSTYFVAISQQSRLATALNATFIGNSTNTTVRLEPINSIQRIVEDHIGFSGYTAGDPVLGAAVQIDPETPTLFDIADTIALEAHVTQFTLGDVQLFVYTGGSVASINPLTGATNYVSNGITGTGSGYGDIAIRGDGVLFGFTSGFNNGSAGSYRAIDVGTGQQVVLGDDGIVANPNVRGSAFDALAFSYSTVTDDFNGPGIPSASFAFNNNATDSDNDPTNATFNQAGLYRINANTGVARDENANAGGHQAFISKPLFVANGLGTILDPGDITGMAFTSLTGGTLLGVDDSGNLWDMFGINIIQTDVTGTGVGFTGLTNGPQNLLLDLDFDGNPDSLADVFFATGTDGNLYAFDASGTLVNVWDTNGDNIADSSSLDLGLGFSTGLAFSNLDFNLWHPTMNRRGDAGHGINSTFDHSRNPGASLLGITSGDSRASNEGEGGASFYFGLETFVLNPINDYFTYGPNAQYGVQSSIFQEVATNGSRPAAVTNSNIGGAIQDSYNFTGGAQGSLTTNSFSLEGYDSNDRPTLYFNYFIDTQGANSRTQMLDSARVFVSADGGANYSLLTTNNSVLNQELPALASVNSAYTTNSQQRVQELHDNTGDTGGWRQARVDLGDFAGQSDLTFRFDFSTAGSFGAVGDIATGDTSLPGEVNTGRLTDRSRAAANDFEGFYIDDIIVGFAERGEIVTDATAGLSTFFVTPDNPDSEEVTGGTYQLEIRRGTEFGANITPIDEEIILFPLGDTNTRLTRGVTLTAPAGSAISDGDVFTVFDGVHTIEFEFNNTGGVQTGRIAVNFNSGNSDFVIANSMAAAINSVNSQLPGLVPDFAVRASSIFTSNRVELSDAIRAGAVNTPLNLTVNLAATSIDENLGTTSTTATVSREGDISQALTVALSAIDPNTGAASDEVTLPGTVTFLAGSATSASFTITSIDDAIADGAQSALIRATAVGFTSVIDMVDVIDDETPTLTLSVPNPATFSESDPAAGGGVTAVAFEEHAAIVSPFNIVLDNVDDGTANVPITFNFDFFGTTYTNLFVSSNGLITFGSGNGAFSNDDLSGGAFDVTQAAIAPLWDDWRTDANPNDAVYAAVIGDPVNFGFRQLVIRWEMLPHFSSSPSTVIFEAVLSEFDDSIQFNYIDLDTGDSTSNGASATVGIKDAGPQGANRLLVSFNDGFNPLIGSGQSIQVTPPAGASQATVTRNTPTTTDLVVDLTSLDLSEASVPTTVTILAGQTSASFFINPVDDTFLDGDKVVGIVASAAGFASDTVTVTVEDDPTDDPFSVGFTIGTDITSSTLGDDSGFIPPDTMGAVGMNQVVEMINGNFEVFSKATGISLQSKSLDQFWIDAGATVTGTTFDPRVIYDPTVDRWFATSIDGGTGNSIFVAVSDSGDPTGNWTGFSFVGDTIDGSRFNDFDTFGLDADGLYIATNNFGAGFDVSIFSIPKADLLLATPTVANLSRFEALSAGTFGNTLQAAVDFGASDGRAVLLSASSSGIITRTDVLGAGAAGATLSTPVNIVVPAYSAAPQARQPGPNDNIENVSPRINSNVVEIGDSLWAVHAVLDPAFGGSAIRWYEIDETSNALLQTGLINDPNLDFYDASIAVNAAGDVVIGFSGSGDSQSISAYAVSGTTTAGVTTFVAPQVTHQGTGEYFVTANGRNRWGDYSAVVVDPSDPDTFWTFQEFVSSTNTWSVQVTELQIGAGVADLIVAIAAPSIIDEFIDSTTATVTRTGDTTGDLVVALNSSDFGEATVPTTVTILDGNASASFTVFGVDDFIADGTQTAFITASATGFNSVSDSLDVKDNETPRLIVQVTPGSVLEAAGSAAATGTVFRNTPLNVDQTVFLTSNDLSEATVPASVVILANQDSTTFAIDTINELAFDGTRTVTIFATASGFLLGSDTLNVLADSSSAERFNRLGDSNLDREQGLLLIQSNSISNALGAGIVVDAGARDPRSSLSHPGAARNLPTLNNQALAYGTVIENNVVYNFGQTGIVFTGDLNTGNVSNAIVPFGKIVNNTIYGGETATGTGIQVGDNASPTILNNIVANTDTGISVSVNSLTTVVGTTVFQGNNNNPVTGTNAILLSVSDPLFVNPVGGNFYLTAGSRAIDSSLNRLEDRPAITLVSDRLGIDPSDIFAPEIDIFGQLRVDDPLQAPPPGLGFRVFTDRGAVERADFVGPTAELIVPLDNGPEDLDPDLTEAFILAPLTVDKFTLLLSDVGIGIDKLNIRSTQFELRRGATVLLDGIDYVFGFNANTSEVTFSSISSSFELDVYTITVDNSVATGVRDLAGNAIQPNRTDGSTRFTVVLGPEVSIDDVVVVEGDTGTTAATFTVTLSATPDSTITIDVVTSDGTATVADNDFTQLTTTVTFNPGDPLTQAVTVLITGDTVPELDETFFVNLVNVSPNARIADNQGLGTIINDDIPSFSVNDIDIDPEGDTGTTTGRFEVSISGPPITTISVDVFTSDGTATIADGDYNAVPITTLTFTPGGPLVQEVIVTVNGDLIPEASETFFLNLTNAVGNATIADAQGIATIFDDEPFFTIDDVVIDPEGDSGTSTATFTVTLSKNSATDVTVDVLTNDGTATLADNDYQQLPVTTLTFTPTGPLTQTVTVIVNGDTVDEFDETFLVNLQNVSANATIRDAEGIGTIVNDDDPSISINDIVIDPEGDTGVTTATFTVSLSVVTNEVVTVDLSTADGSAIAGSDYVTLPPLSQVTFAVGEDTQTFTVDIVTDLIQEDTLEDFFVNLSNPTNATIADAQGKGTIVDDDAPDVTIDDVTVLEGGNGGSNFAVFTVVISKAGDRVLSIDFATADGTATAGSDYTATSGTLVFSVGGQLSQQILVPITGDSIIEGDETFFLNLSNAVDAIIVDAQGEAVIRNDDPVAPVTAPSTTTSSFAGLAATTANSDPAATSSSLILSAGGELSRQTLASTSGGAVATVSSATVDTSLSDFAEPAVIKNDDFATDGFASDDLFAAFSQDTLEELLLGF